VVAAVKGCGFFDGKVGYHGQRYQVVADLREGGKLQVIGWTDDPTGGGLMKMAIAWPAVINPRVEDLFPESKNGM
jgi:hypothetical protein